ncbi:MAG: class I SAM-dependent methyltransferase, partial [Bacillota bacterium]
GAGYENNYVDKHIYQEPELTIFKNARIITGRTEKKPEIIDLLDLPYYYINCPAILSVDKVKEVNNNHGIKNIAFSIQLPHGVGVPNHSVNKEMYQLSLEILLELYARDYSLSVIAHHKSEYFHFLDIFKKYNLNIPVIFSSFYQDMFSVYPENDLVITTRLHSSLFANGFGIPGIIINDTDRHTHTLQGFPHSVWVNSSEKFQHEFQRILSKDLTKITKEAEIFKNQLLDKYISVLSEVVFKEPCTERALPSEDLKTENLNTENINTDDIIKHIKKSASAIEVKKRVLDTINCLTEDYWLKGNKTNYQNAIDSCKDGFDTLTFLNWYAYTFKPDSYLEVGVRRGRSISQVLTQSPLTKAYGFDMWIEDYSCIPDKNIITSNPGPEFVLSELRNLGIKNLPVLIKGDSHKTLNEFFDVNENPLRFDLILIDGDHSFDGAKADLLIAFEHLQEGGAIIFDDITHVSHKELKILWDEFKDKYKDYLFIEDLNGNGTGIAIKPPFKKYYNLIKKEQSDNKIEKITADELPIHFFTIVLNGKPFIEHHINVFNKLPFKWHWHIVEGVADLVHDTAWSVNNGGVITSDFHENGLSNDGTSQYLNELKNHYAGNITIYRKNDGKYWNGKVEMVNAPLENIKEECLLWEIDVDEFWKSEQIITMRDLFIKNPKKTAAFYYCRFFVGENLLITSKDTYGNHSEYEWIRTWRYKPGLKWITHEPPSLAYETRSGEYIDMARLNPFLHQETEREDIIFDHFAYVLPQQIIFKEKYYGYKDAYSKWKKLQQIDGEKVFLKDYFDWVNDDAVVEKVKSENYFLPIDSEESRLIKLLDQKTQDPEMINDVAVFVAAKQYYKLSYELLKTALDIFPENETIRSNLSIMKSFSKLSDEEYYSLIDEQNRYKEKLHPEMLDYISRLLAYKPAEVQLENNIGIQINFDLNDGCNLNCIMCGNVPNKNFQMQNVMDFNVFTERFLPVISFADSFQYGCFYEPLMVPYFTESLWAIKKVLKQNVRGNLITNGTLLTNEKAKAIIDSDLFHTVRFSIDAASDVLFNKIRSGAKFEKVISHIKWLADYRTEKASNSKIELNFTIMKENINELPELVSIAKTIGADSITTHKLSPFEVAFVDDESLRLYSDFVDRAADKAKELNIRFSGQKYISKLDYELIRDRKIEKSCGYFKRNYVLLTVFANGNLSSSCQRSGEVLGNLHNESFEQITRNANFRRLISAVQKPDPVVCTKCQMFQ